MSRLRAALLAGITLIAATPAVAYDNGLVRIEPRPYYGAVVTVEQGVRVYRPLPTQRLMIINPNQTPVSLSFNRTIEHKAADGSSGAGHSSGSDSSDNGSRYGGISGLGNTTGTNPQIGNGNAPGGVGGNRVHKRHFRRPVHH